MEPSLMDMSERNNTLYFTISNINVSYANAIRRVILSDIPTVVIRTFPYEKNDVNFEIKGELTIVISEKKNYTNYSQELSESDKKIITKMINKLSIKEITSLIHEKNKISKKIIYDYCLQIKNKN